MCLIKMPLTYQMALQLSGGGHEGVMSGQRSMRPTGAKLRPGTGAAVSGRVPPVSLSPRDFTTCHRNAPSRRRDGTGFAMHGIRPGRAEASGMALAEGSIA